MSYCYLCRSKEKNTLRYGEFMTKNGMSVHYFCLLLASKLVQSGEDNEGFLGFLHKDIKQEENRIRKKLCFYCDKRSASISCCHKKCRRSFHLICGIKNNALNRFKGTYQSFCNRHIPFTVKNPPKSTDTCAICYEVLGDFCRVNILGAPCCNNGWFHKDCLANFSKTAGYFFKCPLCNNANTFRDQLMNKGIFIPDQDAAWELEPNAFAELLERPSSCSADRCIYKNGCKSKTSVLLICNTCGSKAIHSKCMIKQSRTFCCPECTTIELSTSKSIEKIDLTQNLSSSNEDDEDDEDADTEDDEDADTEDDEDEEIDVTTIFEEFDLITDDEKIDLTVDDEIDATNRKEEKQKFENETTFDDIDTPLDLSTEKMKILVIKDNESEIDSEDDCGPASTVKRLRRSRLPSTTINSSSSETEYFQNVTKKRRIQRLNSNTSSIIKSNQNKKIQKKSFTHQSPLQYSLRSREQNNQCFSYQIQRAKSPVSNHSSDSESFLSQPMLKMPTISISISSDSFEDLSSSESQSGEQNNLKASIKITNKTLNQLDSNANNKLSFDINEDSKNNCITLLTNKTLKIKQQIISNEYNPPKMKPSEKCTKDIRKHVEKNMLSGLNDPQCTKIIPLTRYFGQDNSNNKWQEKNTTNIFKPKSLNTKNKTELKVRRVPKPMSNQAIANQSRIDQFFKRL